jgi:acetate kinase
MKYLLIINSGSATLKTKIFDQKLNVVFSAQVERVGLVHSFLSYQSGKKTSRINFSSGVKNHQLALKEIIKVLPKNIYNNLQLVGHRIVHGGNLFYQPTLLDKNVLKQISAFNKFAPIHNPVNLQTILAAKQAFPKIKHLGVFDTQFFKDLPPTTHIYSIPLKYYQNDHLRKYGFHGLAHQAMLEFAQNRLGKKNINVISCQLGNGVSLTAIKDGKVIDTSMGLSTLSGVTMGTRCGDLDPFIPLYLVKEQKMPPEEVYQMLNFQSGLKGLCGFSELREIMILAGHKAPGAKSTIRPSKSTLEQPNLALAIYLYNIQKYLACYSGLLGQVDAIVFSGGVGQNSQIVRELIVSGVHFISRPKILVVKSNEELLIARKIVKFV